jgi:hypothetical protein
MPPRRREYEISVEQELPAAADGAPRRARLTARLAGELGETEPDDAELSRMLQELADRLARAADQARLGQASPGEPRPERALEELLETYHPRQRELVELLHSDGELTEGEYAALRARVTEGPGMTEAPKATAAPVAAPPRSAGRPVEELLRTYQITSLRQAGAVRARRQISFEEYMSLKRHFAAAESSAPGTEPAS